MALSTVSLRTRLIASSGFAIAISVLILVSYLRAFSQQEQVAYDIRQQEISRSEQAGGLLVELSERHRALTTILADAAQHKIDEERVYERGRTIIDSVGEISRRFSELRSLFQSDSDLMAVFEGIGREIGAYRATVISVIELSTADVSRAPLEMLKANESYLRLVNHMSHLVHLTNTKIGDQLEDMLASSKRTNRYMMAVGGAGLVLVMLVCGMVYRDLSRTITSIADGMGDLADGRLDRPINGVDRTDEVGVMVRSIELFKTREIERRSLLDREKTSRDFELQRAANIAALIDNFKATVTSTLSAATDTIRRMEQTSEGLRSIAAGATARSSEASTASDTMSENVNAVAAAAEELDASLRTISTDTARANKFVADIDRTAQSASAQATLLGDSASRIGQISEVIGGVAQQINLLALNATIEAARAGAYGRGFSVVASEVKALAAQSASATDEIGRQIAEVQELIARNVGSSRSMSTAVSEMNVIVSSIAVTVEQHSTTTNGIAHNSQEVAVGVEELARKMAEVKRGIEQTDVAAASVRDASATLTQQTTKLKAEIADFLAGVAAA